ncbi:MAG: LemA family protein [Kiritimatiellae bacterium]|nr:LemA family protein [Kiritimatiellia bacterium]
MKGMTGLVVVVVGLAVLLGLVALGSRNGLVTRDEVVKENWSQIETQLQRRADLVPNLVATVKGYAAHESKIFTDVAEARGRLLAARMPEEKAEASGVLNSALGRLMAIAENYPNLKADQNFIRLQDELAGTENRIAVARTRYNQAVRDLNASMRRLPGSLFVKRLGLEPAEYYQPPDSQSLQTPPKVSFE